MRHERTLAHRRWQAFFDDGRSVPYDGYDRGYGAQNDIDIKKRDAGCLNYQVTLMIDPSNVAIVFMC
jgi:hypothetical protein